MRDRKDKQPKAKRARGVRGVRGVLYPPNTTQQIPQGTKPHKKRRSNPLLRLLNSWWDRLLGAVTEGSLADQEEEYESHRTSRDYVWNTVGFSTWGFIFPVLTIVVTQISGVEMAGMFSLAFVVANLLFILGNYGTRTYQVSDIQRIHSFADYQVHRILTCLLMLVVGYLYCLIHNYETVMFTMSMGILAFKAIDALADVYEGRLQQHDKLYLGGISQTIRSVSALVVFSILLLITRSVVVASIGMAVVALISFIFVTFPLALFETPKSHPLSLGSVGKLFRYCGPLFAALFMYALIDNMPKFVMESMLPYENQLYFNALYFPAQAILLIAGFIYKPLLVRMAEAWADTSRRRKFDMFIILMMVVIVGITVLGILFMNWIGIPIMSILYGVNFSVFAQLSFIMLAAGGLTACIDFLYQIITILRRQRVVTELYLITFVFSIPVLILMINMTGLDGAVIGYLITMSILFILLLREYIVVRLDLGRQGANQSDQLDGSVTIDVSRAPSQMADMAQAADQPDNKEESSVSVQADAKDVLDDIAAEEYEEARRRLRQRLRAAEGSEDIETEQHDEARRRLEARLARKTASKKRPGK